MRVLSPKELQHACEQIGANGFCADLADIFSAELRWLEPPRDISTLEYSIGSRKIRNAEGDVSDWRLDLTPYLAPVMSAIDRPDIREVIVAKPARSGGTVVAENYALKTLEHGPFGDILWYLAGPQEVSSYANRIFKPLFEDHEAVAAKIGKSPSDNTLTLKRIGGYTVELLAMSAKTTTNRQARFIMFDETDTHPKKFASNFLEQGRQRQRMVGSQRKIYACSHPDIGWSGGISQAWLQSSRGIFIMACAECGAHASPYPTKHWKDIPRFNLHYDKSPERTPVSERIKRAGETAAMLCPHCGGLLDDEQRKSMVAAGAYMHSGQSLDVDAGIIGEVDDTFTMGFWIHALMVSQVSLAELAREIEAAREHRERTTKSEKVKQVLVRTFGEVFEGDSGGESFDASTLRKRARRTASANDIAPDGDEPDNRPYRMGQVPAPVRFITAAVDVGGGKFDVLLRGWDLQRRSWALDRFTIRQRLHADGIMRDINPTRVLADWSVLESQVIDRLLPLQDDPTKGLPIAITTIDTGDGNATWMAYEFARRMNKKRWGNWAKVRCIKGIGGKRDRVPITPTTVSKDNNGKAVEPVITLHGLGVDDLKRDTFTDLMVQDDKPGQCYFPIDMPSDAFDEFFGESEQEGRFVRVGPNETLDLYAYTEGGRIMLQPDHSSRTWDRIGKEPIWARPVELFAPTPAPTPSNGASQLPVAAPEKPKPNILNRFNNLNKPSPSF